MVQPITYKEFVFACNNGDIPEADSRYDQVLEHIGSECANAYAEGDFSRVNMLRSQWY